jgi:hypothetical protein
LFEFFISAVTVGADTGKEGCFLESHRECCNSKPVEEKSTATDSFLKNNE